MLTEFGGIAYSPARRHLGLQPRRDARRRSPTVRAACWPWCASLPVLAGFCYTQFADTYQEANGLLVRGPHAEVPAGGHRPGDPRPDHGQEARARDRLARRVDARQSRRYVPHGASEAGGRPRFPPQAATGREPRAARRRAGHRRPRRRRQNFPGSSGSARSSDFERTPVTPLGRRRSSQCEALSRLRPFDHSRDALRCPGHPRRRSSSSPTSAGISSSSGRST